VHLDPLDTLALAGLASAALDVKAEPRRAEAAQLGLARLGE